MSAVRKIEPKMVAYLDEKLAGNELAQQAIQSKNARLLFWLSAVACVGIKERTGNNDGMMVELLQETVGGHDHEPWCVALPQTCLAYVELKTGVKSPLPATESSRELWNDSPHELRVKNIPAAGAIEVWADVGKYTGHVEVVLSCDGETNHNIGGNTSGTTDPNSSVNREGNGCFYTVRNFAHPDTDSRKRLGFIKPF